MRTPTVEVGQLPAAVEHVYQLLTQRFGFAFPISAIVEVLEAKRGKPIAIRPIGDLHAGITGVFLSLADADVICYRADLDPLRRMFVQVHELAHALLGHIPTLKHASDVPTYAAYLATEDTERGTAWYRTYGTAYDVPQERDAELLASLLTLCLQRYDQHHRLAQQLYGDRSR